MRILERISWVVRRRSRRRISWIVRMRERDVAEESMKYRL